MGRSPLCSEQSGLKRGPWTLEEDEKLVFYIQSHGLVNWRALPKLARLNRCGKSCRLRWVNYLRLDIKRGRFTEEEEQLIIKLHSFLGNKWSKIATYLLSRTDNEIKNYLNTCLRKKLLQLGIDPVTHELRADLNLLTNLSQLLLTQPNLSPLVNPLTNVNALGLQGNAAQIVELQVLQNILQILSTSIMDSIRAHHDNQGTSCSRTSYECAMSLNNENSFKNSSCLNVDKLLKLVAVSPSDSTADQMEKTNLTLGSTCSSMEDIFESWEKSIDNGMTVLLK